MWTSQAYRSISVFILFSIRGVLMAWSAEACSLFYSVLCVLCDCCEETGFSCCDPEKT